MTLKDRWAAGKERNAAAVAANADKLMADTTYDRYRTRRARLLLVGGYLALLVLIPMAYLRVGQLAGLVVVIITAGVWSLLRVSVRTIADLPDDYLDERQLAVRNASYVESYRYLGSAVALAATVGLLAFVVNGSELDTWEVTLTWGMVMSAFWVFLGLALGLPSMVLALNDRV
jgi:hypothetical protein